MQKLGAPLIFEVLGFAPDAIFPLEATSNVMSVRLQKNLDYLTTMLSDVY
jgi:hypothetical protein